VCNAYGPPEDVVVVDVPDPVVGPGEVLVDIHYGAVNFPDVLICSNDYQLSVPVPFVPGSEYAGVVAEVGEGVTQWSPGDRVSGSTFVGAFAERIAVPARGLTPVPDGADLREAAGLGVAHLTAYHCLRTVADLQPGESVLVLGAAGGVGLAAVELATILGGEVVAAARGADKLAVCREYGAVSTIDYSTEDLKNRAKELTGGGAGVVIDPVGGPYSEAALRATRFGSRFVVVGFASGEIPRIPLNLVLLKGVTIQGFQFRDFATRAEEEFRRNEGELAALLAGGRVAPHIGATFALDEAAAALRYVADGRAVGKVVLDVSRREESS
jgi:NADPH:quinone reductase